MSDPNAQEASASVPRPPRENLFRAQPVIELTRDGNGKPLLRGHFAVTNQWTEINSLWEGRFLERFSPGAFKKTIKESRDAMKVLFQHGRDPHIGNKPLGTIEELEEDDVGARYAVDMFDTAYNRELIPGLEAKPPVYGASFRFSVLKEEWVEKPRRSARNPDQIPERTVSEARVAEFGPVTFPAYKGATAGVRSISDEIIIGRMLEDPDRLLELIEQAKNRAALSNEPVAVQMFSDGTTQPDEKPEPSVVTTPRATTTAPTVELYIPTRKERPSWLL